MNVYFISGICVNCKVFDDIQLPEGYDRKYIEWYIPRKDETLEEYTRKMAENIDTSAPFIIVGYSFGAIIMQEMNKFLTPRKNIVISSIKSEQEIPLLFHFARKSHIAKHLPMQLFAVNKAVPNFLAHLIYGMSDEEIERCVAYTSPEYIKWAIYQITNWIPTTQCKNLYHIHGTKDQTFPYKQVENGFTIENGDHLMVMKKAKEVSQVLSAIFLNEN